MFLKLFALLSTLCVHFVSADHWAVIVAGSNTWMNYRHQADVCHAYQVLSKHGIPDENIIVMMFDDIANNLENPTPGKIINKPKGPDVYKGVPKDYTRNNVTSEVFLNVLQGNKDKLKGIGSGKYVNSGPNDNVFVYFSDHGAPGLIAFPNDELHANDLIRAIKNMNTKKRFNKMVLYIEACESGSMFDRHKLPSNINVFATTAANGAESSYACYFDEKRQTYLGDVYSIKWLENSDKANFLKETLEQQFKTVKRETNTSHVRQFGDTSIGSMTLSKFQGDDKTSFDNITKFTPDVPVTDAIPSPDVPMQTLYNKLQLATTESQRRVIMQEIDKQHTIYELINGTVQKIVKKLVSHPHKQERLLKTPARPMRHECYKAAVTKFRKVCFNFNKYEHALRHVYVLSNLCEEGFHVDEIVNAIEVACSELRQQYAR